MQSAADSRLVRPSAVALLFISSPSASRFAKVTGFHRSKCADTRRCVNRMTNRTWSLSMTVCYYYKHGLLNYGPSQKNALFTKTWESAVFMINEKTGCMQLLLLLLSHIVLYPLHSSWPSGHCWGSYTQWSSPTLTMQNLRMDLELRIRRVNVIELFCFLWP